MSAGGVVIGLSEDQSEAAAAILSAIQSGKQTMVLRGPAGTGKTTLMKALALMVQDMLGLCVAYVAPTGKAASRLREILGGTPVYTVHRALYGAPDEEESTEDDLVFGAPHAPCGPNTVLICDEASMVSKGLYADMVRMLPGSSFLLFVGDHEQIPPVDLGENTEPPWGPDFLDPTAELTVIHRQAAGSPIIQYATHIREGGDPLDARFTDMSNDQGSVQIMRWSSVDAATRWLIDKRKAGADAILITYTNQLRQECNDKVRAGRGLKFLGDKPGRIRVGDRLVVCANNHELGLMNGEVFEVEDLGVEEDVQQLGPLYDGLRLGGCHRARVNIVRQMVGEKQFHYRQLLQRTEYRRELLEREKHDGWAVEFIHVDYGECLTGHRCQGSQWDEVSVVWNRSVWGMRYHDPDAFRRWLYTCVTRGVSAVTVWLV